MKRRTYLYPYKIIEKIENEAIRRIEETKGNPVGKQKLGSVSRDIICLAVHLSFSEIQKMSRDDFEAERRNVNIH